MYDRIEPPQLYDLLLISKVQIQKDKPTASEYALAMIVSSFFMRGNRVYQLKAFRSSWNVLEKSTTSEKMKNKNDNAGTM